MEIPHIPKEIRQMIMDINTKAIKEEKIQHLWKKAFMDEVIKTINKASMDADDYMEENQFVGQYETGDDGEWGYAYWEYLGL
jgi:hypothetical protein